MGTVIRGIKNIFRNKIRNIAVILVLCLSLSLALMMINMNFSSSQRVSNIKSNLGNKFNVSGLWLEGEQYNPDESLADEILKINSVISVVKVISGTFSSEKLKYPMYDLFNPSLYKGEFIEGVKFCLYGIEEASMILDLQEGYIKLIEGNLFRKTDIEQNVALIDNPFAEVNNLKIGSDIVINEERIKVCGIFEHTPIKVKIGEQTRMITGIVAEIYIPFKTAQRLLGYEGKVQFLNVTVDSIDNVEKTIDYINNELSDGKIMAYREYHKYIFTIEYLDKIKRITKVSMILTFVVGALIILLIMFINIRERAKEIGILKAIGASNLNISTQFLIESITLCSVALILSVVVVLIANQFLADFIIEKISDESEIIKEIKNVGMEKEKIYEIEELTGQLFSLKIIFSPQLLLLAILLTILLATIGSLIPAFYISKLRPAEVLRFG